MGDIQKFLADQDEAAKKQADSKLAVPGQAGFEWPKPEYDAAWQQHCRQNQQTGMFEPLHPDWAPEARKLNAAIDVRRQNSERLLDDLPSVLNSYLSPREEALKKSLFDEAVRLVRQEFSTQQQRTASQSYIDAHLKDFFACDQTGQVVHDASGDPVLSPKGIAMQGYVQELREMGATDENRIIAKADQLVAADEAAGKFVQPGQPRRQPESGGLPIPGVRQRAAPANRFLDRVAGNRLGDGRTQQRGGRIPDDTAPLTTRRPGSRVDYDAIFEESRKEHGL